LPAAELPEYAPHPEDLELDNEPTLFEQVMAANVDDSSDEEDDDDDAAEGDEDDAITGNAAKDRLSAVKRASGLVVDHAGDSEEDN